MADKRSFEEQVREQLTGLNMQPDEEVWEKVGSALRDDRKKRWIIWLFLLTGTVSAATYGVYHSLEQTKEQTSTVIGTQRIEKANGPAVTPKVNAHESDPPSGLDEQLVKPGLLKSSASGTDLSGKKTFSTNTKTGKINARDIVAMNSSEPVTEKTTASSTAAENEQPPARDIDSAIAEHAADKQTSAIPVSAFVPKESGSTASDTSESSPLTISDKKSVPGKTKHPWKLYAVVDLGKSALQATDHSGTTFATAPPFNWSSNNYSAITTANFPYFGNATWSTSYRLGLEVQKELGKKWDIGFLLAYQSFTTQVPVGRKVDSLLSAFSRGTGSYYMADNLDIYTNRYHILQAGLSIYRHFKLDRGNKKLSLRWQAGIEGNWLFSSNALYYNSTARILYSDRELINKFQTSISTAFEFGIGKNPFIYFGPGINYFITDYDKVSTVYNVRHLWNYSLKTHVPLFRNKKK